MSRIQAGLALLVLAVSCAPSPPSPLKVQVLVPDPANRGKFKLRNERLTTVTDLGSLTGKAASFKSGVKVLIDTQKKLPSGTVDDIRREIVKSEGETFKFAYSVHDDVAWPEDWHSLNAATTYFNFERSWKFFHERLGLPEKRPGPLPVAYWVDVTITRKDQAPEPERDNAAFYALLKQFWVYPFDELHSIPLSMNPGIIAHEYSHAVHNSEMFGSDPIPSVFAKWTLPRAFNVLKGMDEGMADAFAAEVVGDPNFMEASIPEIASSRRLDRNYCYALVTLTDSAGANLALHDYVTNANPDDYNPYHLGTVVATTLWSAAEQLTALGEDRTELFRAVLAAQQSLGETIAKETGVLKDGTGFELNLIANAIAAALPTPAARAKFCSLALDRWAPMTLGGIGVKACLGVIPENNCPH